MATRSDLINAVLILIGFIGLRTIDVEGRGALFDLVLYSAVAAYGTVRMFIAVNKKNPNEDEEV